MNAKIIVLTLCLFVFIGFTSVCIADEIVIASDEWCPINCEPGSSDPGAFIEIAQKAFASKGHTIKYVIMPWTRALKAARTGEINGVIGAFKGDAPDFIFPQNEQLLISNSFFVKKENNWTYGGVASLSNVNLGAISDYDYGDPELNDYIAKGEKVQLARGDTPLETNIKKLSNGRIDVLIAASPVFWYLANKLQVANTMKEAGQVAEADKAYIAFSPTNPSSEEYAKILSDGMDTLRQSGELKSILAKYGLQDWK